MSRAGQARAGRPHIAMRQSLMRLWPGMRAAIQIETATRWIAPMPTVLTHRILRRQVTALTLLGLATLAALAWLPASAHHSFSAFNRAESAKQSIRGVVSEFSLINPHGWLKIDVADPGARKGTWSFELSSATQLQRIGWKADALKVGDSVEVVFFPLRFGSFGGLLLSVKAPDGQLLSGIAEPDRGYPKPKAEAKP